MYLCIHIKMIVNIIHMQTCMLETQAKEMRTDARRQQRLDKNKRNAEVKKRRAAVRVCVCMRACVI